MVGGRGGSAKSDFVTKGSLIKHLVRGGGGVKKGQKSSDVIDGRSLTPVIIKCIMMRLLMTFVNFYK